MSELKQPLPWDRYTFEVYEKCEGMMRLISPERRDIHIVALSASPVGYQSTTDRYEEIYSDWSDFNDLTAFIVRACNSHRELLEASIQASYWMNCESRGEEDCVKQLDAAIARAEGKE